MRFGSLIVVLAVTLVGCKNDDPNTSGYWVDKLSQRAERAEALKQLGKLGDKTVVPEVVKWLQKDGEWQADAAYTLGQLGDTTVVGALVAALDPSAQKSAHQKNRLNANVARALALLKATDSADHIAKLLRANDDRVREAALQALASLKATKYTDTIAEIAVSSEPTLVRYAAVQALGEMGDVKGVPALIQLLFIEEGGISLYNVARFALIQIGNGAVSDLLKTLHRQNKDIENLRFGGQPLPSGVIEAKAASALGAIGAASAEAPITAAFTKFYAEAKANNRSAAYNSVIELAYALGNLGTASAAQALVPLAKDTDANLRIAGCEALITTGYRDAAPALIEAAKTGDEVARRVAVVAASRLGRGADLVSFDGLSKGADPSFAQFVADERPRLAAAKECGEDKACWQKKLADATPKVRERAAYELGWLGAQSAVTEIVKLLEDASAEVRMAAVLSLLRLGGADTTRLQAIYDQWQNWVEYMGVNQELLRLIARTKAKK